MKRNRSKTIFLITTIAILGFSVYAIADWDGYGMHGRGGRGMGYHMGWGDSGSGYRSDLSEEDYKKLDEQMQSFYKETESIRQKIYEKELALRSELAKENPDAEKAAELQKELSKLESEFNQKRLNHQLALRKTNPNFGRGYSGRGGMMGYGPGSMMMGYGPRGCY